MTLVYESHLDEQQYLVTSTDIATAFFYSGWSNVIAGVSVFSFFDCSITK